MSLITRTAEIDDKKSVRSIHEKAFGQPDEANLVEAVSCSDSFIKELSILAELDDQVVGHILYSSVKLDKYPDKRILALAPVAVLPQYQHKGIGTKLIEVGNKKADELSFELITVLGEPDYYQRFGFRTSTEHGIKCPFKVEAKFYMVLPLSHYEKETSASVTVIYPKPFQNV